MSMSRRRLFATAGLLALPLGTARAAAPARGPLRLIANENPHGPSPAARAAAGEGVARGWQYALREIQPLKRALARHHDLPPAAIMVSAGSAEALRVAVLAFARDGGDVVAARPTFAFLPEYARELGCRLVEVPLDASLCHDLDAMAAAIGERTRLVYICNPNNPSSTRLSGERLRAFVAAQSARVPVVVDEAYLDIDDPAGEHSAIPRVRAGDRVVVTRTFSKLHGMAGLRIGYAIAPPPIIRRLESLRISQLNLPGVLAAQASLADRKFLDWSRRQLQIARRQTTAVLDELGLEHSEAHGNFVFFDTGAPARRFMRAMRERGILTGMPTPAMPTWARVSIGTVEQMQRFAAAARDYFGSRA